MCVCTTSTVQLKTKMKDIWIEKAFCAEHRPPSFLTIGSVDLEILRFEI